MASGPEVRQYHAPMLARSQLDGRIDAEVRRSPRRCRFHETRVVSTSPQALSAASAPGSRSTQAAARISRPVRRHCGSERSAPRTFPFTRSLAVAVSTRVARRVSVLRAAGLGSRERRCSRRANAVGIALPDSGASRSLALVAAARETPRVREEEADVVKRSYRPLSLNVRAAP